MVPPGAQRRWSWPPAAARRCGKWLLSIGMLRQDATKSERQCVAHGSHELGARLAVIEGNIPRSGCPARGSGRALVLNQVLGEPEPARDGLPHLEPAHPGETGEMKEAVLAARGELQQRPAHGDHIHRRADLMPGESNRARLLERGNRLGQEGIPRTSTGSPTTNDSRAMAPCWPSPLTSFSAATLVSA